MEDDIETLAAHYHYDERASRIVHDANVVLLVGISGAGKDTIQGRLLELGGYQRIITHTTRQPRENNGILEINGREYHFVSRDEMRDLLQHHEMIEVNHYNGNFYGTSLAAIQTAGTEGSVAIGNIDVNGIDIFRELGGDTTRALFILPPDYQTWKTRLLRRYTSEGTFAAEFPGRRDTAIKELEHALAVPYYHFIINDSLDRAVRVVDEIAHQRDMFNRHDDEARLIARDLLAAIRTDN